MAWKESGGGGDDPCVPAEAETLLEDTVTSPDDRPDGRNGEETREIEEQPLINNDSPVRQSCISVKLSTTPKMSKREKSSVNSPLLTSRNSSKVPVMVNLDPSDRVSLNTGSTLSVRTSPSHANSANIPLQRSTLAPPPPLPLLPSPASQGPPTRGGPRPHGDEACIQVAESDPSSPEKQEYEICSSKNLCGPNPKKVTVIVALILSIWASFILGVNIHKKVVTMEDRLSSMTQKMLELQIKYLDLQKKSSDEIISLHDKLHKVLHETTFSQKETVSSSGLPQNENQIVEKRSQTTTKRSTTTTSTTTTTTAGKCLTTSGKPCILPFTFEGKAKHGCVQRWTDTAKWCAIKVDQNGAYIKNDKSSWDYCDESCPLADEKDDFWDF